MSHEPQPAPVAHPLALVVTGSREKAVALEEALRRYFATGLERLTDDEATDPRAALEALEDCARARRWAAIIQRIIGRPVGRSAPTTRFDDTRNEKSPTPEPKNPRVSSARVPRKSWRVPAKDPLRTTIRINNTESDYSGPAETFKASLRGFLPPARGIP